MLRRPLLTIFLCAACGSREAPTPDSATPATLDKPVIPVTPTPAPTPPLTLLGLPEFIGTRLTIPGNPVEVLAHGVAADKLSAHGVREYRAYTATAPRVWLLLFRFDDQPALLAHQKDVEAMLGAGDADDNSTPPYYVKSTYTGAWLLVTGFPSHKPVSPEMEAARTAFLARFAGEE